MIDGTEAEGHGIYDAETIRRGIVVRDGTITGFSDGVHLGGFTDQINDVLIENIRAIGNAAGIVVAGSAIVTRNFVSENRDIGINVGVGSNVTNNLQGFVTRRNPDAPERGALGENQQVSLERALQIFTLAGAYAVGEDDELGSIEVGKQADLIVLDRNLFEIEPEEIRGTRVLKTILAGRVVYDRARDKARRVVGE